MRVVRQASPPDAEAIHRCHLRSWAAAYADIPGLAGVLDTPDALERVLSTNQRAQAFTRDTGSLPPVSGEG